MAIERVTHFITLLLLLINNQVMGRRRLTTEEYDLDKQFKQLKKPSFKTIKTKYGDIYDCIDFYNQPAFDHPLLKNHTFHHQMKPSIAFETSTVFQDTEVLNNMELSQQGCPTGTVPIKRVSKDEFIKTRLFTKKYASRTKFNGVQSEPGNYVAIAQTKSNPRDQIYKGVRGALSLYNFTTGPSQYSSSEFIIKNGDDSIRVGWTINPTINKDNRPRTFQYLNAGQSHCFNLLCPGFVQVHKRIPIGSGFKDRYSKRGSGPFWSFIIHVFKDPKDGNWWLESGSPQELIGFWPQQIFTRLANSANYVAVGGDAYSPADQPLPPMGNGYYPMMNPRLSAYCHSFTLWDEHYSVDKDPQDLETYSNNWHYNAYDYGIYSDWGHMIMYGGPKLQI